MATVAPIRPLDIDRAAAAGRMGDVAGGDAAAEIGAGDARLSHGKAAHGPGIAVPLAGEAGAAMVADRAAQVNHEWRRHRLPRGGGREGRQLPSQIAFAVEADPDLGQHSRGQTHPRSLDVRGGRRVERDAACLRHAQGSVRMVSAADSPAALAPTMMTSTSTGAMAVARSRAAASADACG